LGPTKLSIKPTSSRRATVLIENLSDDVTLEFKPGVLEFGADPWARHDVTVSIATDEYIQHVTLHDRYVIDDNSVAPASDALATEIAFSDQNAGSTFVVDVRALSAGVHNFVMAIPVRRTIAQGAGVNRVSREREDRVPVRLLCGDFSSGDLLCTGRPDAYGVISRFLTGSSHRAGRRRTHA
jgi:hypothetical protein